MQVQALKIHTTSSKKDGTAQSAPVEYLDKLCMIGYVASKDLAPVVQTIDSAIRRINHYLLDNSIGFASVYPLDSDLSSG